MSATDADRLTNALAWQRAMNAPAVRTINPPALVGPSANALAWLQAIDPTRDTAASDDPLGTRAAAANWMRGVEASAAADTKLVAELEMTDAQRWQAAKDACDAAGDAPPTRCY